jgi:hypothetical protein
MMPRYIGNIPFDQEKLPKFSVLERSELECSRLKCLVTKLKSRISELESQVWLPITTAPKTGELVLILDDFFGPRTAFWNKKKKCWKDSHIDLIRYIPVGWVPIPKTTKPYSRMSDK